MARTPSVRSIVKKLAKTALPPGTTLHHKARQVVEFVRARRSKALSYDEWMTQVEAARPEPAMAASGWRPRISIVVPTYNTADRYLDPLMDSILAQTYDNWELVLVQGSTIPDRIEAVRRAGGRDKRVHMVELETNEGIAKTTNAGLAEASGDFIAFLDHDDTLAPFALAEVVAALQADPKIEVFYSDEDKVSDDGAYRSQPLFKPAWSPELFLGVNYLAHFVVVKAELVREAKGIRLGYEGAQDYDFLLRVTSRRPKVQAVRRLSYHWRQAVGSTGMDLSQKDYATGSGLKALQDYVKANRISADVEPVSQRPTEYRLKYRVAGEPVVALVPAAPLTEAAFSHLKAQTAYPHLRLAKNPGDAKAGELLLLFDPALTPLSPDWLSELIGLAQQSDIAWAGASIVTSDGRSAGIGYTPQADRWEPLFAGLPMDAWTYMGPAVWPRNLLAVNPHCAIIEATKLKQEGETAFFEASMAAHRRGLRSVHWPHARLQGNELLASEPLDAPPVADPYVHPSLTVQAGTFVFAPPAKR